MPLVQQCCIVSHKLGIWRGRHTANYCTFHMSAQSYTPCSTAKRRNLPCSTGSAQQETANIYIVFFYLAALVLTHRVQEKHPVICQHGPYYIQIL
ncbi:hypothetical protein XENTR_v10016976 [Xenopus tropicalis]|nr:hypothetical protein XENTR_v10016976 [Xenopus tropicalis]